MSAAIPKGSSSQSSTPINLQGNAAPAACLSGQDFSIAWMPQSWQDNVKGIDFAGEMPFS
jgi:hypothetical protein